MRDEGNLRQSIGLTFFSLNKKQNLIYIYYNPQRLAFSFNILGMNVNTGSIQRVKQVDSSKCVRLSGKTILQIVVDSLD